jgi:hypothetical protein
LPRASATIRPRTASSSGPSITGKTSSAASTLSPRAPAPPATPPARSGGHRRARQER